MISGIKVYKLETSLKQNIFYGIFMYNLVTGFKKNFIGHTIYIKEKINILIRYSG